MAGFSVLILKIAFLAILWILIIIVTTVVSSDMGGRHRKKTSKPAKAADRPPQQEKPSRKGQPDPWILAIDSGSRAGERLQLVPEVHIGRSAQCELVLDDDYISGQHAVLRHRSDGSWVLTDENSTNGTYVNATRITAPTVIGTRDVIRVGDVQMRLETA